MRTLLIVLFTVLPAIVFAQIQVKGKVRDLSGEPVPFAVVSVLDAEMAETLGSAVTDLNGIFESKISFQVPFKLRVSIMGYEPYQSETFELNQDSGQFQTGEIVLSSSIDELEEVLVAAAKPLVETLQDRLVLNIGERITFSGSSVLEVLEKSPGISVNRQGKSITLFGKEGVLVMINGKQTNLPLETVYEMISGMNADRVEKIEIIHSPPAGMDASGTGGVINIINKSDGDLGTTGTFTLNAGFGISPKAGGSVNVTHKTPKFTHYLDYAYSYDDTWQNLINERTVKSKGTLLNTSTLNEREPVRTSHIFSAGSEYKLTGKSDIGLQVSGFGNLWKMKGTNTIEIQGDDGNLKEIMVRNSEKNSWRSLIGGVYFRTNVGKASGIQFHFDRLFYHNSNPSTYQNKFNPGSSEQEQFVGISKETPIDMYVSKIDYQFPLSEKIKVETGVKFLKSQFKNSVDLESDNFDLILIEDDFSGTFYLDESVKAAYISGSTELNGDLSINAGLRWEHTLTGLEDADGTSILDRNYHDLFPTVSIRKGVGTNGSIQFSAGRRIFRPTYNQLAPFVIFLDPLTFASGNTQLKPSYSNYLNLGFNIFSNYNLQIGYSLEADHIVPWQVVTNDENNSQFAFPNNVDLVKTLSSSLNFPVYVNQWWEMDNSFLFNIQQSETQFLGEKLGLKNRNFQIVSNQLFNVGRGWKAEISGMYRSRALMGIGLQHPMGSLGFGVQKDLKDNLGTLRFSTTDILKTMVYGFDYKQPDIFLDQKFQMINEMRVFRLSYNRRFGNQKIKQNRQKSASSEDQQRVGGN